MTFEKYSVAPISERTLRALRLAVGLALDRRAAPGVDPAELAPGVRGGVREGVNGQLEPNFVNDKGSRLLFQVPTDPVRHYFLLDDPAKQPELQALVRRLQRMDVSVYRLTAPLTVPDFKPYGRSPRPTTLPAGTYWIPMAQQQKHWIQGMLNEDTYVAFPYFYDISGWSNPLLFNVGAGARARCSSPSATLVAPQAEPAPAGAARRLPSIAVLRTSGSRRAAVGRLARVPLRPGLAPPYARVTAGRHRDRRARRTTTS